MISDDHESTKFTDDLKNSKSGSESEDEVAKLPNPARQVSDFDDSDSAMEEIRLASRRSGKVQVLVSAPSQPWKYKTAAKSHVVDKVLKEFNRHGGETWYRIQFEDGREEEVSFNMVMGLQNGRKAIYIFNTSEDDQEEDQKKSPPVKMTMRIRGRSDDNSNRSSGTGKRSRSSRSRAKKFNISNRSSGSDDDGDDSAAKRQRVSRTRGTKKGSRLNSTVPSEVSSDDNDEVVEPVQKIRFEPTFKSARVVNVSTRRSTRISGEKVLNYDDAFDKDVEDEDLVDIASARDESSDDEILFTSTRPKRSTRSRGAVTRTRGRGKGRSDGLGRGVMKRSKGVFGRRRSSSSSDETRDPPATRVSGRATKTQKSMKERLEDEEIFADEIILDNDPKVVSVREVFQPLSAQSAFRNVHSNQCDVCDGVGNASNKGPSTLIYCQGCSTSIHRTCLGSRSTRDHMVTKIGEDSFVMQCRKCIGVHTKKDPTAPRLDVCQVCRDQGVSCAPFSQKKTAKQEQKLRDENDGKDPITSLDDELLNNSSAILFRCNRCWRGFHFQHLPPLEDSSNVVDDDVEARLEEYSQNWQCKECLNSPTKVQSLVAWRPTNLDDYEPGQTYEQLTEDGKEYLIKWEGFSYFRCTWMPGAWVWGVVSAHSRNAFARRADLGNSLPKMSEADAIPEEFLRMEIVMDVKYSSSVSSRTEEVDKARVTEVDEVFVKFQGLGYDEVVWERPPSSNEIERWADFVAAYNEYVAGKYFKQPSAKMNERIEEYRKLNFQKKHLMDQQPASLTGGEMMAYQMEGLNWLLYNFYQAKNVILADEMGLGKTIQIIAALAALVKDKPKCWPFLVVVPNSTCPNWRREIKRWAPSLRVVAYYGVREARDMAMKYELYPDGSSDLRAHVVITSFDAPADDHSRHFFRKVRWAGLIVDEGQRLKNDKNLLYGALSALKVPFRVLMTGTPLQNNKRELFNLLQFIDSTVDAEKLDEQYADLTDENLPKLHKLIRPYFLRRTKIQVLKFLPPMAQVIVPVTMSVLQKKVYKNILSRSPDLIKAIMTKDQAQIHPKDRGSLNNMLMQLRKVLCHPFIYSEAIEERVSNRAILHRNLVDAASKLQLLEIMLPKLQERGHRVLIFSQFLKQLDIVEDFLDGLGLQFQRLDGNIGTLEKQKRIDLFNAPESPLFAFLLSTRAGGVGINLATADTVIIMDPDFNPHQDIQALSRAHRIGQKKKVLVFQFMTKDSAEEKIVQIGRKKMALDHALIETMDADDDVGIDLQSILKHGAQALFNDDDQNDIKYDSTSVDKLLDRSQVENTNVGDDNSAESQFSFARLWANDTRTLVDDIGNADSDGAAPSPTVWDKILKQREADAAREAAAQQKSLGRGKRMRQVVDYRGATLEAASDLPNTRRVLGAEYDDNSDFAMGADDAEEIETSEPEGVVDFRELEGQRPRSQEITRSPSQRRGMPKKNSIKSNSTPKKNQSAGKSPIGKKCATPTKSQSMMKAPVGKKTVMPSKNILQKSATPKKAGMLSKTIPSKNSKAPKNAVQKPSTSKKASGPTKSTNEAQPKKKSLQREFGSESDGYESQIIVIRLSPDELAKLESRPRKRISHGKMPSQPEETSVMRTDSTKLSSHSTSNTPQEVSSFASMMKTEVNIMKQPIDSEEPKSRDHPSINPNPLMGSKMVTCTEYQNSATPVEQNTTPDTVFQKSLGSRIAASVEKLILVTLEPVHI